jgi:hypothetical protein
MIRYSKKIGSVLKGYEPLMPRICLGGRLVFRRS